MNDGFLGGRVPPIGNPVKYKGLHLEGAGVNKLDLMRDEKDQIRPNQYLELMAT